MGYYKEVWGKILDGDLYTLAEHAQKHDAGGVISEETARKMYEAVIDGGVYSKVEKDTVNYLLNHMHWNPSAKEWFLSALSAWERASPEHRTVEGTVVDKHLYEIAEDAANQPGGMITMTDARVLLTAVIDGGIYTDVEQETVRLIRKNMVWLPEALQWFNETLTQWENEQRRFTPMTLEAIADEHFPKTDVLREENDRVTREIDLKAATMQSFDNHDEIGLIVHLSDGRRVQVSSNLFELHETHVELRGGVTIPIRAIEKVQF